MPTFKQKGNIKVELEGGAKISIMIESNTLMEEIKEMVINDIKNNFFNDAVKVNEMREFVVQIFADNIEKNYNIENFVNSAIEKIILKQLEALSDKNDFVRKKKEECKKGDKWKSMFVNEKIQFMLENLVSNEFSKYIKEFVEKIKITA